ncbi:MAG: Gfo/Idh/MocA family oxidoreductase [Armatimonadota bacterium]|nr:MAG: Gfo/Idh/MocA family oxidoreductase [Armatimonadota bacterium]
MTLRLGLLGAGIMGRELADAITQHVEEAQIVSAYDPYPLARDALCKDFDAEPAPSEEDLLRRADIEAVLIATPNHLHCEQTLAAASAGKHVFCEKPMALSAADCDRMIAACERAGVKLMVGQSTRLYPLCRRLLELTEAGDLGDPLFGLGTCFFPGFEDRDSGLWHVERARSGGLFFHMAIHQIDLFHALFGPAARLQYSGGHYGAAARDFDDVATILLEFQSGATGAISVSSVSPVDSTDVRLIFSRGFACLDSPWSYLEHGPEADHMTRLTAEEAPGPGAVEMELRSFARWVLHDDPPVLTAAEGRAAVAVAEAADNAKSNGEAAAIS